MKKLIHPFSLLFLVFFYSLSCQDHKEKPQPPLPPQPLDEATDLAAFLDGEEGKLYVADSLKDSVLTLLSAEAINDSTYSVSVLTGPLEFSVAITNQPYLYTPDGFGFFYDSIPLGPFIKIWFGARCNWNHPGFIGPCIRTFGAHRRFGNAMEWTVNNWKSCSKGDSICIEFQKPVGTIRYYRGLACIDSIFIQRNILRFRCD